MMDNLPIYAITDGDLTYISLVEFPAVETDFMCFSKKHNTYLPMRFNDEKREITGVAMIADKPIYRFDYVRGDYYVVFSREIIERLAYKFFKQHRNTDVNIEHEDTVDGVTIIESYFINHRRNILPNEFDDLADGSWIVTYKVDNEEVYQKIKSGELRGFSIQGDFWLSEQPINQTVENEQLDVYAYIESLI